jgi:hypothetical protein
VKKVNNRGKHFLKNTKNVIWRQKLLNIFKKKKGRLLFVVQGKNPCPGEEWRKENREEQRGLAVFPLLFFPRGRICSMRREKKHKNVIKKSQKISFSLKKIETLPNCR